MKLHLCPNVRCAEDGGFLVVLHLRTGSFHVLDAVATSMWKALLAADSQAEALDMVEGQYEVSRPQLESDFAAFRQSCIVQGFFQASEPPPPPALRAPTEVECRRFLAWRAWWSLFRTVRSMSRSGLFKTYSTCLQLPASRANATTDRRLIQAEAAFSRSENFFLMSRAPLDCLPRSLALFRFLRLVGVPAEHCIGVSQFPFQAHAWVECLGRVVLDRSSRPSTLRILARISA